MSILGYLILLHFGIPHYVLSIIYPLALYLILLGIKIEEKILKSFVNYIILIVVIINVIYYTYLLLID